MISLIVALTPERVIGRAGGLPWRLSADLQRFKQLTMGHHIIMGRKTFDSLGRPLPGRTSIVITRNPTRDAHVPAAIKLATSLEDAIQQAVDDSEVFIIGGGEIYRQALPLADRVYATWVEAQLIGDTYFPEFPTAQWQLLESHNYPADAKNEFPTRFGIYERQR